MISLLNNSKLFWGITMIIVNMGSRFVVGDLSRFHETVLMKDLAKKVVLFCMFFLGSRDVMIALCLTFAFSLLIQTFLNEKSPYNLLPKMVIEKMAEATEPTEQQYKDAKAVVTAWETANNKTQPKPNHNYLMEPDEDPIPSPLTSSLKIKDVTQR